MRRAIVVILVALVLAAGIGITESVAGQSSSRSSTPRSQAHASVGDTTGVLSNFIGGTLDTWSESEFLNTLGISPGPTRQQFNVLEEQMTQVQNGINQVYTQMQEVLLGEKEIQAWLTAGAYDAAADSLEKLLYPQQTAYGDFASVMQDGSSGPWFTLQQLGNSQQMQTQLAIDFECTTVTEYYSCTNFSNGLYTDSENIVGGQAASPGQGLTIGSPSFGQTLFQAIRALSMEDAPTLGQAGGNLVAMADQNDETVTEYVTAISLVLQQDYNIMATMLYLKYCANDTTSSMCSSISQGETATTAPPTTTKVPPVTNPWADIVLPYTGFNENNTAQQNFDSLNLAYQTFFNQLEAITDQAIISDNPGNPGSPGTYTNLKTWSDVNHGPWNQSCNLFAWSGASQTPNEGYTGSYNGQTLQTQCYSGSGSSTAATTAPITPTNICSNPSGALGVAFAPGSPSGTVAQLECQSGISNSAWWGYDGDLNGGGDIAYSVSNDDPHGEYYFNLPSSMSQVASESQGAKKGWDQQSGQKLDVYTSYTVQAGTHGNAGSFWVAEQWQSPSGYVGPFVVSGSGNGNFTIDWSMSIACVSGDTFCSGGVGNGICLAGYPITISSSSSNTADIKVGSLGGCTVPNRTGKSNGGRLEI